MKILDTQSKQYLISTIRDIKDFPKPNIVFKDITTLLNNKDAFQFLIQHLKDRYNDYNLDFIAGIESRGFIFGAALCNALNVPFVPIRKPKKLPYKTLSKKYSLEYGNDEVEIHIDAFRDTKGARVLLIDDLIATGGTAKASVELINEAGANCIEACFIINLTELSKESNIEKLTNIYSVLEV